MLFLKDYELTNIKEWTYHCTDLSITTELFRPFWNYVVDCLPSWTSPNMLTIAGFLCILEAYRVSFNNVTIFTSFYIALLLFLYQTFDACDGILARKTKNCSQFGELLDHFCDNVGLIFIILISYRLLHVTEIHHRWVYLTIALLLFLREHLNAYIHEGHIIIFNKWTGPNEILTPTILVLMLSPLFDISYILNHNLTYVLGIILYVVILADVLRKALNSDSITIFAAIMIRTVLSYWMPTDEIGLICESLFWCLLTTDIVISKMAKKDITLYQLLFALISCIHPASLLPITVYAVSTVSYRLLEYLRVPFLRKRE